MARTKRAATKSSGKGKNVDLTSSSEPIPEVPNPSKKKTLLAERGFIAEKPNPDFLATVEALGWQKFVVHRKEFIATLVHDFYKGIVQKEDGEPSTFSKVRGEEVNFGVRVLNDYFGLGYYGKAVEVKQTTYGIAEMNEIKNRICVEGAMWERRGDHGSEFKILRSYLCEEANTWFHFIRHSLLPTSHTSWVDKERMIVIDAIMSRDKIEVGKLINREINKWKNRKDGYLYFPCLITDLCMEAGVEIEASELWEKPQGAFPTKFKARQRTAGAATSVDAQTLQRLGEQQNSLAKFVREQFEWQKKVNEYVTKGKMAIEEPVLPEWMQEEDEENVPLSMNLRAVKKERAKRARSSTTKGKSPAKKKQKKVSSEEESDEPEKVSMEVLSEEEEEEQEEEEGSSSEKTDIQADSPPTPKQTLPQQSEPSTHTQSTPKTPQSKQQNQPSPQPQPTQLQSEKETQQQPPSQEKPAEDVITSEAAAASQPETQPMSPPKTGLRVKSVAKKRPFGKKTRQELPVVTEEPSVPEEVSEEKREKLPVKKKAVAPKGKPATATSAAFVAATVSESDPAAVEGEAADVVTSAEKEAAERLVELQESKENEKGKEQVQKEVIAVGDASTDVITSQEPEVEKAQVDPKEPEPAMKAWEEAKKRVAEASAKESQTTEVSAATSTMAASDETTAAGEVGGEKKKKGKKKNTARPELPPRQSGRLRSGALNK